MSMFGSGQHELMSNSEIAAARISLGQSNIDEAQVHATLAVAYAQLDDMSMRLETAS